VILIDGAEGHGGGQLLRTSLALSLITGRPFEMVNVRAARNKPGLRPQHAAAVAAARAISGACVEGEKVGSARVRFVPGAVRPGSYAFDVGTAGSASLVLHTVFLPLALAGGVSRIAIAGGTDVPWSPPYDFLAECWAPFMRRLGLPVSLRLERAGFYPRGGGLLEASIGTASSGVQPLDLPHRGELRSLLVRSTVANLPDEVMERQGRRAVSILRRERLEPELELERRPAASPGTVLAVIARFANSRYCCTALGARGKRAERVAEEACRDFLAFLGGRGAVDEYLGDQLLLPLVCAAGPSRFCVHRVTKHLPGNASIIPKFLPVSFEITGEPGALGEIRVNPGIQ